MARDLLTTEKHNYIGFKDYCGVTLVPVIYTVVAEIFAFTSHTAGYVPNVVLKVLRRAFFFYCELTDSGFDVNECGI